MYINKVTLYGNLTRDPESRALPSGQQVVSFGMATNRTYKDKEGQKQEQTEFHNVVAFGRLADVMGQVTDRLTIRKRISTLTTFLFKEHIPKSSSALSHSSLEPSSYI